MEFNFLRVSKRFFAFRWAVIITAVLITFVQTRPVFSQNWFPADTTIQHTLKELVREGRTMGVVVGLVQADGTKRTIAFGSPGPNGLPLDGESVFEIGSITKVFTGILLADMVRRDEVNLTDPISTLLPAGAEVPTRNGKKITLLDITTHHSGLPRMPDNHEPRNPENPYADYTEQQLYDFLSGYTLPRDPGEAPEYSNYAMGLLGHALSLHAGKTYEALLKDRILGPLGMKHTAITLTPWMENHLARGHNTFGDTTANWDIPTLAGAGALRSTVNDMLIFAEANLSADSRDTGLSEALYHSHQPLRQLNQRKGQPADSVGFNWVISKPGKRVITWHNGGTGGYRAFLGLDLGADRAVVVLTNTGGGGLDDLGFHLLDPTVPLRKPPIGLVIASTYRRNGLKPAIKKYRSLWKTKRDRYQFGEDQLNELGYWLLERDSTNDAIEIFRLNVESYPEAANPHDSLGDALMAASRYEEAIASFKRAVEIAEANDHPNLSIYRANLENARKQLRQN